ncbi:aminotransferase class III-fold pyridoxal phosphate-dependent enzyme [Cohnella soli]|uniref:Aminotransferase class III-fold pyridoxal phosphate-dependent enzyme n=1 Tax=Cohnella soli TaxID=425005 RepID=A0ABW0HVY4_9BACL
MKLSLVQLLGSSYMNSVIAGATSLLGLNLKEAERLAHEEVEFLPEEYVSFTNQLLTYVGKPYVSALESSLEGAPTNAFGSATNTKASPIGGLGGLRLGEDGRLYLAAKSEHYHTPLGHNFPGYRLIDNARALGITNATHNNTRGYITRFLERELVRTINGFRPEETDELDAALASQEPQMLNRVLNLETGTLACEAGIKMMLARFYRLDETFGQPKYGNLTPVFFVMADHDGGGKANYHGTTIFAQIMRDMWPGLGEKLEQAGILKVCPVRINDWEDFQTKFEQYNKPPYKAAGFLHEIILMNYGGIKLEPKYLQKVYALCHEHDTPIMCDEIQSCMWYPPMYLFREYKLNPDFVVIGKGFPGGQYPASRIITTAAMDTLNQFGALVTNGQEELAALAYLITMKFTEENGSHIRNIGQYYEDKLRDLAVRYPDFIDRTEGLGHLSTIFFREAQTVTQFTKVLNEACIDVSAQTYKASCPPAALTKPPTIATREMIDYLLYSMDETLLAIREEQRGRSDELVHPIV